MNYIADAKELFFENKEHYLAFRKAWKAIANDPNGYLDSHHFMFYSAIRGRDCFEGFQKRGPKKAYHQGHANPGTAHARAMLKNIARGDCKLFADKFDNTISPETIRDVIGMIPAVSPEYICTRTPYEEWKKEYMGIKEEMVA